MGYYTVNSQQSNESTAETDLKYRLKSCFASLLLSALPIGHVLPRFFLFHRECQHTICDN